MTGQAPWLWSAAILAALVFHFFHRRVQKENTKAAWIAALQITE
jgi:hypothetical protein